MPCDFCDDTGWKPVEIDGIRRVVRCDCRRDKLGQPAPGGRQHPETLSALHDREFHRVQRIARARSGASAGRSPTRFPQSAKGLFLEGQPGVGKTHLAVAVLKQVIQNDRRARSVLRHARSAARHPQHVRSVDQDDGARSASSGHDRRSAGPGRSRRREDIGMGRGDDEPDRQHALQRAADRRSSRRTTKTFPTTPIPTRCCFASAIGCGRACTRCASSRCSTAPTIARCRSTAAWTTSMTLWKTRKKTTPLPARAGRHARAQLREPAADGRADLKWPGGRAGS